MTAFRTASAPATSWDPASRTVRSSLTGTVSTAEVEAWRAGLDRTVAGLPDGTSFKLLVDLTGYEPADLDAHKAMRGVVPSLLLRHGLRPAVLDLIDDPPELRATTTRGVTVAAFANVHHDAEKMAEYDRRIGRPDQRFFADRQSAESWLAEVP